MVRPQCSISRRQFQWELCRDRLRILRLDFEVLRRVSARDAGGLFEIGGVDQEHSVLLHALDRREARQRRFLPPERGLHPFDHRAVGRDQHRLLESGSVFGLAQQVGRDELRICVGVCDDENL